MHPSRRLSLGERNWRFRQGWQPPELVEKYRKQRAAEAARAALFDVRLGPGVKAVLDGQQRAGGLRGRQQGSTTS